MRVCVNIYLYVCVCIYIYIHICKDRLEVIHRCEYIICVGMCEHVTYIHTYTELRDWKSCTGIHEMLCMSICVCVICIYLYVYIYIHTYMGCSEFAKKNVCVTYMHTYTELRLCPIHIYIHTYIHGTMTGAATPCAD